MIGRRRLLRAAALALAGAAAAPGCTRRTFAVGRYMCARTDGILPGGTFERDVWSLEPNREAERRILADHERFFAGMT